MSDFSKPDDGSRLIFDLMRNPWLRLVVPILLVLAPAAAAQDNVRPDFSGTWAAVPDPAAVSATGRPLPPVWGEQFSIDHKGQNLTLSRTYTGGPTTIAYVLDGTETTSRMPGRLCEPDSGATWTAAWDGPAVAIAMVGALPPNGKPIKMDVKSTLRLEAPDTLKIEQVARVANQPAPRVATTTYKRKGGVSAAPAGAAPRTKATLAQVSWISGVWTAGANVTTVEERWTPAAGGSMIGVSRTIRDGNPGGFEFLCIVERDGGLTYQAMPNGRSPATDFNLTKIDADNAVFENPAHDFPKMIRYTRTGEGSLEAVVSGEPGTKPITFRFKRQQ
jgi:hypothetical protein